MKYLVVVAVLIITGLLSKHSNPQHINKQVDHKSEAKARITSVKQETVTQPKVVQANTPIITSTVPNCDKYDALITENFGSENLITAKAVMEAESSCRTDAVGDLGLTYIENGITYGMSCGLFQVRILPGRDTCDAYKDPVKAIQKAGSMFKASGWKPWGAHENGRYKLFL